MLVPESDATYTTRCAEKLRKDDLLTGSFTVGLRTSYYKEDRYLAARSIQDELPLVKTRRTVETDMAQDLL